MAGRGIFIFDREAYLVGPVCVFFGIQFNGPLGPYDRNLLGLGERAVTSGIFTNKFRVRPPGIFFSFFF